MSPYQQSLDELFCANVEYRVPLYHRRYVWDETNWSALWDDILKEQQKEEGHPTHFMGPIVTRPIGEKAYEVIDGQQRLATFQIILCVIRDICQLYVHDAIARSIDKYLLNDEDLLKSRYTFLPGPGDSYAFYSVIDGNPTNMSHHLILEAYDYFNAQITAYVAADSEKIKGLVRSITDDFCVVRISLDTDTPENIFSSINATGRRFSEFDLLRNNLFLRAGDGTDTLYHMYWHQFDTDPFWNPETLSQFLQDFLKHKLGQGVEINDAFEVYQRHYLPTLAPDQGILGIEYELSELKQHAEVYRAKVEGDA